MDVVTAAGGSLPPHRRGRTEGEKKALLRERSPLPMFFGAVPMRAVSVRFASSCRALAPRKQPGGRHATSSTEYSSVQWRQQCNRAVWWGRLIQREPGAHIVSAGQSAQPLDGFFGIAASTCDLLRAVLGALWAARPVPRAREKHMAMCRDARSC